MSVNVVCCCLLLVYQDLLLYTEDNQLFWMGIGKSSSDRYVVISFLSLLQAGGFSRAASNVVFGLMLLRAHTGSLTLVSGFALCYNVSLPLVSRCTTIPKDSLSPRASVL